MLTLWNKFIQQLTFSGDVASLKLAIALIDVPEHMYYCIKLPNYCTKNQLDKLKLPEFTGTRRGWHSNFREAMGNGWSSVSAGIFYRNPYNVLKQAKPK